MSITAKNEGGSIQLAPAGNHIARCTSMVQIGTVKDIYNGEVKIVHKVRLSWELPTEKFVFNEEKGEQPFTVSKEYTLSFHEKSTLRKDLQSWRGRAFTDAEAKSFDITKLLGIACMLNVIHQKSKTSGKEYSSVISVSGLPRGVQCPPQINPCFVFSLEKFDEGSFNLLPEWLRKRIVESKEYKSRNASPDPDPSTDANGGNDEDDCPF